MKVEGLSQYGKGLFLPRKEWKKQEKVIFNLIRKEFGYLGVILLMIRQKRHSSRIRKEFPQAFIRAGTIGCPMVKQLVMMGTLFFAIADKRGGKFAKKFMTRMMQNIAPVSMPAIYSLDELIKCGGKAFDNFKKFNRAMFTDIDRMGIWKNSGFNETKDLLEFKITSCINVDFFKAIGCPEISTLGCDHDLAGYSLIEDATNSEFRRPCTLAKGGCCCHFHFYRKGTAPDTAHLNK